MEIVRAAIRKRRVREGMHGVREGMFRDVGSAGGRSFAQRVVRVAKRGQRADKVYTVRGQRANQTHAARGPIGGRREANAQAAREQRQAGWTRGARAAPVPKIWAARSKARSAQEDGVAHALPPSDRRHHS